MDGGKPQNWSITKATTDDLQPTSPGAESTASAASSSSQTEALLSMFRDLLEEQKTARADEKKRFDDYVVAQKRNEESERSRRVESDRRNRLLKDLPRMRDEDDIELYLQQLEKTLRDALVPPNEWLTHLERRLNGHQLKRFTQTLTTEDRLDFKSAKEALLNVAGCSLQDCAEKVFYTRIPASTSFAEAVSDRHRMLNRLCSETKGREDTLFVITMRNVLACVTKECAADVARRNVQNQVQLITVLKEYESLHGNPRRSSYQQAGRQRQETSYRHRTEYPQRQASEFVSYPKTETPKRDFAPRPQQRQQLTCYNCQHPGHRSFECPERQTKQVRKSEDRRTLNRVGSPAAKDDIPSRVEEGPEEPKGPWMRPGGNFFRMVPGQVGEKQAVFMLDSGADVSVVKRSFVKEDELDGDSILVSSFRGSPKRYPTALVTISTEVATFKIRVAAIPEDELTEHALLGSDLGHTLWHKLQRYAEKQAVNPKVRTTRAQTAAEEAAQQKAEKEMRELQPKVTPVETVVSGQRDVSSSEVEMRNEGKVNESSGSTEDAELAEERNTDEVLIEEGRASEPVENELVCDIVETGGTFREQYVEEVKSDTGLSKARDKAGKGDSDFMWEDGILLKQVYDDLDEPRKLIALPQIFHKRILVMSHDRMGHLSGRKVIRLIARAFWWPGMKQVVLDYCRSCTKCQHFRKQGTTKAALQPVPVFTTPFTNVAIDLVGPFEKATGGYRYLLTYICLASRYPEALPLKTITAEEVAENLLEIFSRTGVPHTLLSDQGTQFTGSLMERLCKMMGCKKLRTTPFHPQANGCVERMHGTLVPMLKKSIDCKLDWVSQIKFCLFALRSAVNRSTGFSPFEVVYGRNVRSPLDVVAGELIHPLPQPHKVETWIANLQKRLQAIREEVGINASKSKEVTRKANRPQGTPKLYKPGEMVLLRVQGLSGKLEQAWEGPYEVMEVKGDVDLVLGIVGSKDARKRRTVHVNNVKPFVQSATMVHRIVAVAEFDEELEVVKSKLSGEKLGDEKKGQLEEVLGKWDDVLSGIPGETHLATHDVVTGDAQPVRSMPYRLPDRWKDPVRAEVQALVASGMAQPSTSPWSSPIVPVPKPDGSLRLCIDYRRLNSVTTPDPYCMPLVEEILDKVGEAEWLSKLDLAKGFYQVPLTPEAKLKSAFTTPFGKFQFNRMPFGMRNAPATFQRLMDVVLQGAEMFAAPYIDDVLVFSKEWKAHLDHIKVVLGKLREAGLTAKPSKCEWGKQDLEYLGHHIGQGKISVPEAKAQAINNFVKPTTKKGIRSFLGTTGYYRKFILDYATKAKPLTAATCKKSPDKVVWSLEMEDAFRSLRMSLSKVCSLHVPVVSDVFLLQTDASGVGIGSVLSVCREGKELPVAFFSRQLKERETRYCATELECLAVLESIRHFEVHLIGREFRLETDHKALESLLSSKVLNRKLTRWALYLQEFCFSLKYRPGLMNANADGLSRQERERTEEEEERKKVKQSPRTALSRGGGDVGPHPTTHLHQRGTTPTEPEKTEVAEMDIDNE